MATSPYRSPSSPSPSFPSPSPIPHSSLSRSHAASPRPNLSFQTDLLKPYIKTLLSTTLHSASWNRDREKVKGWMKEIGERVKARMVEIQQTGFKYIVLTQINENLGQGGRADMACHWEDSDTVAQEMFTNDTLICICIAFAIRTV